MINLVPTDSHLSIRLLKKRRLPAPQVAEEEGENLEASPEEEEVEDESMDEAEGSLPSLGKRRSTDTALSGQTSAKRSRPGSLAEVSLPALRKNQGRNECTFWRRFDEKPSITPACSGFVIQVSDHMRRHPCIHTYIHLFVRSCNVCSAPGSSMYQS